MRSIREIIKHALESAKISEEHHDLVYGGTFGYLIPAYDPHRFRYMVDGRQYSAILKRAGFDIDCARELKESLVNNQYAMCRFWRAMVLYVQGYNIKRIRRVYGVKKSDIKLCHRTLSNDHMLQLLRDAPRISVYTLPDDELREIIRKGQTTARAWAGRLSFIKKYDPAFDPFEELQAEAVRIAHYYSSYPDAGRVLGCVRTSVGHAAKRLIEYHTAQCRRRIQKMPEWRCPECRVSFTLEKEVMKLIEILRNGIPIDETVEVDPTGRFCPNCAKEKRTVQLAVIDGERSYTDNLVTLDLGSEDEDGDRHALSDVITDADAVAQDSQFEYDEFVATLSEKLGDSDQEFLRIFLGGDRKFDDWSSRHGVKKDVTDLQVLARLICEYLRVDFEEIQMRIGHIMGKPMAYLVQCGDGEDATRDVVFAKNPKDAVAFVATEYRFKNGKAMQEVCGRIRVRGYHEFNFGTKSIKVEEGQVIPIPMDD